MKRVRRKIHRVSIESSDGNSLIRTDAGKYAWAKPYNDPNIKDIPTGLGRGFRYSPIFKNSIVDTMVKLTGYRSNWQVVVFSCSYINLHMSATLKCHLKIDRKIFRV